MADRDGVRDENRLIFCVEKNQLAIIGGVLGITKDSGNPGDMIGLDIEHVLLLLIVPSGFDPTIGDNVYIIPSCVTGHTPDNDAYTTKEKGNLLLGRVIVPKNINNVLQLLSLFVNRVEALT